MFGEFAGLPITSGIYAVKVTMILKVDQEEANTYVIDVDLISEQMQLDTDVYQISLLEYFYSDVVDEPWGTKDMTATYMITS